MKIYKISHIKIVLIMLFAITMGLHIADMTEFNEIAAKIPRVSQGQSCVFTGEMGRGARISAIDATEECIYFAYSTHGVVAVYGWDGVYKYSIAFFSDSNGTLGMRCENGLLYVCDYAGHELVFSGEEQIAVSNPSQRSHLIAWFHETKELPLVIQGGKIYTNTGSLIMQLPGKIM